MKGDGICFAWGYASSGRLSGLHGVIIGKWFCWALNLGVAYFKAWALSCSLMLSGWDLGVVIWLVTLGSRISLGVDIGSTQTWQILGNSLNA